MYNTHTQSLISGVLQLIVMDKFKHQALCFKYKDLEFSRIYLCTPLY